MTWTKTGDEFTADARRARLSDAAYRLHHETLTLVNRLEGGPRVERWEVSAWSGLRPEEMRAAAAELVAVGWWLDHGDEVEVVAHYADQVEPAVLARRRALTAERVRRHRMKAAGLDPDTGEVARPASRAVTALPNALPGSGRDGSGRVGKPQTNYAPEGRGEAPSVMPVSGYTTGPVPQW